MNLYICLTYYHVLITIVKSLIGDKKNDIMISNDIPGFDNLQEQLENCGLFSRVIVYDANKIRIKKANNKFKYSFDRRKSNILRIFGLYFKTDLSTYSDIYLFNDATEIGLYMIYKRIYYHLIEDALDFFKYFNDYYGLKKGTYSRKSLKYLVKRLFGVGFISWGTSKYCLDIEVNDQEGIKIPNDKVIVIPRKELFGKLSDDQRKLVYQIFAGDNVIRNDSRESVLLCTQPLFKAGHVDSYDKQKKVFESIVKEYTDKGYQVVIKPHPRDEADYSAIAEKYHCGQIDKNLPSEILDYNPEAKQYYAAISITSTSINSLDCANKKIFLGMEYLQKV